MRREFNEYMMEKDKTITGLLKRLTLEVNFSQLEVVDFWEADLCAIGLRKNDRLVYISTYNITEDDSSGYDFDLEAIEDGSDRFNVIRVGRNVSEIQLINEIKLFLEI